MPREELRPARTPEQLVEIEKAHQAQKAAKTVIEHMNAQLKKRFPEFSDERSPRWMGAQSNLIKLGKRVWQLVTRATNAKKLPDDVEVLNVSFQYARAVRDEVLGAALMLPPFQLRWLWAARWYEQGMPRIVWDDSRYAEMLMASRADPETAPLVRPPWDSFLVELPQHLLYCRRPDSPDLIELRHVLVQIMKREDGVMTWNILAEGADIELWRHGLPTEHLIRAGEEYLSELWKDSIEDRDERILVLLGRLLIGLCLTLSDPNKIREAKHTKRKKYSRGKVRSAQAPETRTFVVGKPVTVRVRTALVEYVEDIKSRNSTSPSVQVLVRGHWKMQPHGPQNSLRKLIHLEPHWRGPEKDPIAVRDHVVAEEEIDV